MTVVYSDDTVVKQSTIDRQNVLVIGPNNANQLATLVSVSSDQDGSPLTATYSITVSGGTWDSADIGVHTIPYKPTQSLTVGVTLYLAAELGTFWADQSTYAVDFDGDGNADLLWRDSDNQKVVIWLMDGTTVMSQSFLRGYG